MLRLSINILTWNCIKELEETLDIIKQDMMDIDHEIVIVDNGSTDGCQDLATIRNKNNLGVSIGKNQGLDASKGEYIFLLDGDIVPVPNSINCLLDYMNIHMEIDALGFYPNKFTAQHNTETQKHHEERCYRLSNPKIHSQAIVFYGMFREIVFQDIRFPTDGPFSGVGYGWEDSDVYMQMREKGIFQWVAGINEDTGRYYHRINSSIKLMGDNTYIRTSKERAACFHEKWGDKIRKHYLC